MTFKHFTAFIITAFCLCAHLGAQDMVRDGGSEGLMKTVTYDMARFIDIRDKKLSDVLVKMPGISGSGTWFSYNGMDISKVYINGADVLEGNNEPAFNLKPEDVESIEITENHISIKVMRGKMYSNSASINIVLKGSSSGKWSGSIKAMAGAGDGMIPATADINAMNLGPKSQTTVMVKADNTGLDFAGPLHGWGDYGEETDIFNEDSYSGTEGVSGGFDYNLRKFLDVEPALAPLSTERVRFNRSAVAQVGTTRMLSKDYQLNLRMTLHGNRLNAESNDETTYYMGPGENFFKSDENALMHQYDIQTSATLLSNTDRQFLRNQLIFNHRQIDMFKEISGTNPNSHDMDTKPIYLKNDFHIKRLVGGNILSINAMMGYNSRPQHLRMSRSGSEDFDGESSETIDQNIGARSSFIDIGAKMDFALSDKLNISVNAGAAYNARLLDVSVMTDGPFSQMPTSENLGIMNVFGGAQMTYINERMQAKLELPLVYGGYSMNVNADIATKKENRYSVFCVSPKVSIKYDISKRISVNADLAWNQNPIDRKRFYSGKIIRDFKEAMMGYPSAGKNRAFEANIGATYRNPEKSLFINGSAFFGRYNDSFFSIIMEDGMWMSSAYVPAKDGNRNAWYSQNLDINKGISSLKGKIGLSLSGNQSRTNLVRNSSTLPCTMQSYGISPYVNGRLSPWCNMIYKLDYKTMSMRMGEGDSTVSQSYQQTLEMIFSPWQKINFSLLGEHYYTEFTENDAKHLVLVDFKAEYRLNDNWQLLLTATNILNQKTYNYTLVDSDRFTRSYTSYGIRPINVLLGVFFKF